MTDLPDKDGKFGIFGGRFVPETLMPLILELEKAFFKFRDDYDFKKELSFHLKNFVGRETPMFFAKNLTDHFGGAKLYFKREDMSYTGAHKINNSLGQALLAKRMGKLHVVAETGAGQHGVATASVCALLGLKCTIFMGAKDVARQSINVMRMKMFGAEVFAVESGEKILKDAINEAMRFWVSNPQDVYYLIGTVAGSHPYPLIVRHFQSIMGEEARRQIIDIEGKLPKKIIACIGGGSNAIGIFYPFLKDDVELIGVESGGVGNEIGQHAATIKYGKVGVLQGNCTYLLQDENGNIAPTTSVAAGLDYPGIGPEHAYLYESGRVKYHSVSNEECLLALKECCLREGILPAIESSHAIAYSFKILPQMQKDDIVLINLSGRGDKDLGILSSYNLF